MVIFFSSSLFRIAMTDEKHKLKRSPTLSVSSAPKPKEKKIPVVQMDTLEEEKEAKAIPRLLSYIQRQNEILIELDVTMNRAHLQLPRTLRPITQSTNGYLIICC